MNGEGGVLEVECGLAQSENVGSIGGTMFGSAENVILELMIDVRSAGGGTERTRKGLYVWREGRRTGGTRGGKSW